jgi:D-alanyl-D-alanine carboxypeptidase (penicillin-binding protein 5/6)
LADHLADQRVDPASLTKLLTAYLSFAAIRDGTLKLDHRPPVSEAAWKAIGSRMFIEPNKPATVEELLNGMIVQSGNDASIALAEAVAGSEAVFAQRMNREAQRLGMTASSFRNATGLPDPQHYSTAADLARLATRLIDDFPQFYAYYAKREYAYNGIRQPNRNRLLTIDPTVDGLKTGHTDAAGWCLIASAKREQQPGGFSRRLLTVVIGAPSESARIVESQKLLNWGFQSFDAVRLFTSGKAAGTYEVWKGSSSSVTGGFEREITVSVPKGQADQVRAEIERLQPLLAPIARGQRIGTVRVKLGDQILAEQPMVALGAVDSAGFVGRQWDAVRLWWRSR